MDVLTHTAVGVTAGLAGYRRWGRAGTLWLAVAANLPELERAVSLGGPAAFVEVIYGAGHSLITVVGLGLLLGAWLARRRRNWRDGMAIAGLGLGSHLVLDLVSGPGVRLLWPVSQHFFGLRLVARYDLLILASLGIALIGPLLLNLVNQDIGAVPFSPDRAARTGLVGVLLLLAVRGGIMLVLEDRVAGGSRSGFALAPSALHPLTWYAVMDEGSVYTVGEVTPWRYGPELRYRKALPNRAFETAADSPLGQAFLEIARFPQYSLESGEKGMLVRIRDLRFYTPAGEGKEYSVEIEVTPQLEVVRQRARM